MITATAAGETVEIDAPKVTAETVMLADDFPQTKAGLTVPRGFTGRGIDRTVYRMRDNSSTRAAQIAALVPPATNPYYLMRMGGGDLAHLVDDAWAKDFTLVGPELGHTFGGLFVGPGNRGRVENVSIRGCQGRLNGPPEETGLLVVWGQRNCTIVNVDLDGRNSAGVAIASSPLMLSACTDTVVTGLSSRFAAFGFAAALWRMAGVTRFVNCYFGDSRKLINIEQAEPNSEFVFERSVFGPVSGADYVMQVSTRNMGRAKVTFVDPVGTAPIRVRVYGPAANAAAGGNGMQDSDIRVIVAGVDVTASRLRLVH